MKDSMNLPKKHELIETEIQQLSKFLWMDERRRKKLSLKGRDKYTTLQSTIILAIKHNYFIASLMLQQSEGEKSLQEMDHNLWLWPITPLAIPIYSPQIL